MVKQRMIKLVISMAFLAAAADSAGLMADTLGLAVTSPVHACSSGGTSGGGC